MRKIPAKFPTFEYPNEEDEDEQVAERPYDVLSFSISIYWTTFGVRHSTHTHRQRLINEIAWWSFNGIVHHLFIDK